MSARKLSRQQHWRIERIQAERARRAERREASRADEDTPEDERPGRVVAHFGHRLEVEDEDGKRHLCHLRANLDALVTGDRVSWRPVAEGSGVVEARLERVSTLERPDSRGRLRPVAANIDRIMIVFAAEPEPYPGLIDRYLVAAEATGITPALILNKADLLPEAAGRLHELLAGYQRLGYEIITASVRSTQGLNDLHHSLLDQTAVFVGQSGVGKSSLIDALLPDEQLRVGALSGERGKGTHTTTTARLYQLPAGGQLIDSPGIREFGLGHLDERQVAEGFIEFRPYLGYCRFRDCHHAREPGCALREAVERGEIDAARFESFRHIVNEQALSSR
ncbi:ribosome biogenesis GTPase [Kushneria sinocarnis]|uniref:Small ribosomal subunit biogenesis GTPase RsgA n=1 Tax=Kushneria sinocarnis TaxID=595502 RepID=A0A420WT71_9GAMM|nr:small ribosomal subunit biogenesis GTPase RsgA [Kushneria sinocarnis]RKQ96293.1 ribosome biogenesis GTPase [Kushneria sinocarnis]